jgi:long-chain acyl-CoA synthetase
MQSTNKEVKHAMIILPTKNEEGTGLIRHLAAKEGLLKPNENIDTVLKLFEERVKTNPDNFIESAKGEGYIYRKYTWKDIQRIGKNYAHRLIQDDLVGVTDYDNEEIKMIGIYSKSTPEWAVCHLGNMYNSIATVGLYDTLGVDGISYVLKLTKLKSLIIQLENISKILELINREAYNDLKNIIHYNTKTSISEIDKKNLELLKEKGMNLIELKDLFSDPKEPFLESELKPAKKDNYYLVSFTSGSTGNPKGALLSHHGMMSQLIGIQEGTGLDMQEGDTQFSYLPYPHIFEHVVLNLCIYNKINMVYFNGNVLTLFSEMAATKPNFWFSVPRLLIRIYQVLKESVAKMEESKRTAFEEALIEKLKYMKEHRTYCHPKYDEEFFKPMCTRIFGRENLRFLLTGSAPIEPNIAEFIKCVCQCPLFEAYGLTETSGAATITTVEDIEAGHVGIPIPSSECKLIDAPEFNYFTTDEPPRGEILIRGNNSFIKYLGDPERTKEMIDSEGWIHTGDIATIIDGKHCKIIDRRKNIFKLSQGEYIAPERIENVLKNCPYVLQTYIHGKSTESYVVVLGVTDINVLKNLSMQLNIKYDAEEELIENENIKEFILREMNTLITKEGLCGFEHPRKIKLSLEQFTIESGMLTATMKNVRSVIKKRWEEELNQLYSD